MFNKLVIDMSISLLNTLRFITGHPLNSDKKIRSILHFLKWQIGVRMISGAIIYDWIDGSKFIVRRGETGLTGNIYAGLHEFPDMSYLLHVLRTNDLFVDVGANVGSYTILACAVAGAHGYAFEPVPDTFRRLIDNIRINNLDNKVECVNKGVGASPGSIAFTGDRDTMNHALSPEEKDDNAIFVEVTTLGVALEGQSPIVMKIDVEGYETAVLDGAEKVLRCNSLHSVIMELNGSGERYGFDESRILEVMRDHGFKTYSYDPFNRELFNLRGKNLNSGNTLFIRDEALVVDRLKSAKKIFVNGRWL